MAVRAFLGTWEVTKFQYINGIRSENNGLEGVKFRLDESGDVTWTVSEELKSVPLFSCETYELYNTTSGIILVVILRFGAYAGHVIEFRCDHNTVDQLWVALRKGGTEQIDHMALICEGWCVLHCKRINDEPTEDNNNVPFSLLPALEDAYFSDIVIMSANNKQFKVHSSILQLLGSEIAWQSQPTTFTGLPENVLGTILHFLYTECLPSNLDEATAQEVIEAVSPHVCLKKLVEICQLYLKNLALKQQIIGLVTDMHAAINQVIDHFSYKTSTSTTENISANPSNLCFVIKQSIRDTAVAGAKLLMLCDLFTRRKNELSREERHEIILYAKSRLPIFLVQLLKLLQVFKTTFTSMSIAQRQEVATFLVPEIELILDTSSILILEVEKALQQIIQVLSPNDVTKCKSSVGDMLGKSLRNVLHIRELTKLKSVHEQIACALEVVLSKKENFNEMTPSQKVKSVARNLEQVIEELPMLLLRLEEITSALDDTLEWREFKFCFKVGTSKISGILQKLVSHRDTLQDVITQLCELVQRDAFTQSMQSLELLSTPLASSHSSDCQKENKSSSFSSPKQQQQSYKLSLVESLCVPPSPTKSHLSKLSLQLLKSGIGTDMEFEVVSNNSMSEQTMREHAEEALSPVEDERTIIRAHRVIVAARCDWFRRALLSGMREAIDKKIIIHDTNPFLFRVFLEYLYSGRMRQSSLTTEQLSELLLLSDRYEVDSLKQACERALQSSIDMESVLYYLSMADQFNARILRNACLTFISQNHELTESELFYELPIALQAEIFDCVWAQPPPHKSTTMDQLLATPSSPDTSLSDIPKGLSEINLGGQQNQSNCSSLEDLPIPDTARLDQCITQLHDILGDTAPREKLVQVILAADYDLCRAINYFYARSEDEDQQQSSFSNR